MSSSAHRELPSSASSSKRLATGFWLYAAQLWTVFGLAASNIFLGLAVLAIPWSSGLRWDALQRRLRTPETRRLLLPIFFFALFLQVSILASYEPDVSLGGLSDLFALVSLVAALFFVRGEHQVRILRTGVVSLGVLLSLLGLAEYFIGTGGLDLDRRIRGPLSHYQTFAGVLLLCDLMLICAMLFERRWRRVHHWAALLLINAALFGSLTRGAWVGLAVGVTLLVVVRAPRFLIAYAPALLLFVLLAPPTVVQRAVSIVDLRDQSNYDRLCMAYAGALMIAERPFFGIGPDLVAPRYPIYRHPTAPRLLVPHLHNSFLQLAAERGLLSLAAYLWLCAASVSLGWRRFRDEGGIHGPRAGLYTAAIVAIVAFNVAGIFEDNWGDREVQRVLLFALAVPACLGAREEKT